MTTTEAFIAGEFFVGFVCWCCGYLAKCEHIIKRERQDAVELHNRGYARGHSTGKAIGWLEAKAALLPKRGAKGRFISSKEAK